MKPAPIDFAPATPGRALARSHALSWLALLAGGVLCLGAVLAWSALQAERRALAERDLLAQRRALRPERVPRPAPAIAPERLAAVNAIVMQLNLPWGALREAVAQAATPSIGLLALEPDARKRSARLSAEAKNAEAMIAYVARLKREPLLASVVLTHHDVDEQDPNRALRFELLLTWEPR